MWGEVLTFVPCWAWALRQKSGQLLHLGFKSRKGSEESIINSDKNLQLMSN